MIDPKLLKDYNQTRYHSNYKKYFSPFSKFCYAPFSSLYFGHQGKVTACCENRQHELGTYPENTLSEIWNGEPAAQLRKYIAENNLWHGCRGCELDLKSRNFDGIHAKIFDDAHVNQSNKHYPSLMEFELENTCNLECVMCSGIFSSSIRKNRENLPPILSSYDDDFVRQLEEFIPHLNKANFFGGEPFLIPIYYQIWDKMAELNPEMNVWVITNGSILNNRVKDLLGKLRFNITMSIDSMQKENYEKIRVNSSFDKVMEHLKYFNEYTKSIKSDFTINTCPMTPNWQDLPDMVKVCNDQGIIIKILPVKHPEHISLRSFSSEKLYEVVEFFQRHHFEASDYHSTRNKKQYEDYLNLVSQWYHYNKNQEDIENSSSQSRLSPKEKLFEKINSHINLSSSSEKFKTEQTNAVIGKINKVETQLREKNLFLSDAIINIANRSIIEEVVNSLITLSGEKVISETKDLFIEELDKTKTELASIDELFNRLETYSHVLEVCDDADFTKLNTVIGKFENISEQLNKISPLLAEELLKSAHRLPIKQLFDSLVSENEFQIIINVQPDLLDALHRINSELENSSKEKLNRRLDVYFKFLKIAGNTIAEQSQILTEKSDRIYNSISQTDTFLAECYLIFANSTRIEFYVESLLKKSDNQVIIESKQSLIAEINKGLAVFRDEDKQKLLKKLDTYFSLLSLCTDPAKDKRSKLIEKFERLEESLSSIDPSLSVNLIRIANRSNIEKFVKILSGNEKERGLEEKIKSQDDTGKKRLLKKLEIYFSLLELFNDLKSDDHTSVISKFEAIENQLLNIEEFLATALYRFADHEDIREIAEAPNSDLLSIAKPFLVDEISRSYEDLPLTHKEKFFKKLQVYSHLEDLCKNEFLEKSEVSIARFEKIEKELSEVAPYLADAFYSFVTRENIMGTLKASDEELLKNSMPGLVVAISRMESHLLETDQNKLLRKIKTYFKLRSLNHDKIENSEDVIKKFENIRQRLTNKSPVLSEALISIANKGLISGLVDSLLAHSESQALKNAMLDVVSEVLILNDSKSLEIFLQMSSTGNSANDLKKRVTELIESA